MLGTQQQMRHKACAFRGGRTQMWGQQMRHKPVLSVVEAHRCGGSMAMTSLTLLLIRVDSADLAGSVRVPSLPHTVCVPLPKLQAQNHVETSFA